MPNILVVEDMQDWSEQLSSTLKRDGYAVKTAGNYVEALDKLHRREYQLAIVDLRLSPNDEDNRDGMELLRDLANLKIPSVVVTGYGTTELARDASDEGTLYFLEKNKLDIK